MNRGCSRAECTVAETGICLLNNDPENCPERLRITEADSTGQIDSLVPPPLTAPVERPRFPHSLSLSPAELQHFTGRRYHHLVGILGAPNAGKTAVLVSLYLLLANNKLGGYEFADSYTLMAFDEISRGARRWNSGHAPDQMTVHTELGDERTPGFLHLRLRRVTDHRVFDVVLPDVPGEWSDTLIDHNRTDRLSFLRSADMLWITVDGSELADPRLRKQVLHRIYLLFQRVSKFLRPDMPPVALVISHRDLGQPEERSLALLKSEAARYGIPIAIASVASFSDNPDVQPGTGIAELLDLSLSSPPTGATSRFWPLVNATPTARYAMRFRVSEGA